MTSRRVGFAGWRGLVGSVLSRRLEAEKDLEGRGLEVVPLSSSDIDFEALESLDVVVTCQGNDYTDAVYGPLRARGWKGHWIDAASRLRHEPDAFVVLPPVNGPALQAALANGCRTWVGANCTASLLLIGLQGLFRARHEGRPLVRSVFVTTYQAASGAGAKCIQDLVLQMGVAHEAARPELPDALVAADRAAAALRASSPLACSPLACSVLPWIDEPDENGRTKEEAKTGAEAAKILRSADLEPPCIDGLCVRVPTVRSHCLAVTLRLAASPPLSELEKLVADADFVRHVPNERAATLEDLTPLAAADTLSVRVGRLRYVLDPEGPPQLSAFVVGDQLFWGAAEPLRRTLLLVLDASSS